MSVHFLGLGASLVGIRFLGLRAGLGAGSAVSILSLIFLRYFHSRLCFLI